MTTDLDVKDLEGKEPQATVVEGNEPQQAAPKASLAEEQALELGWVPKDKWNGDPEDWVPARQFIRNGELFGRINSYRHKIIGLEKTMQELVRHNEKVYETGYKDALDSLKKERREAIREGDAERALELEEQEEALKEKHEQQKQEFAKVKEPAQQAELNPAWTEWLGVNDWYEKDVALRGYADGEAKAIVQATLQAGKQVEYEKLLKEVGRKVREKFPEKFGRQPTASAVNKGDDEPRRSTSKGRQLTQMEEEMFQTFAASGMTREKYIEDLDKLDKRKK